MTLPIRHRGGGRSRPRRVVRASSFSFRRLLAAVALLASSAALGGRSAAGRLVLAGHAALLAHAAARPGLPRYYTLVTWATVVALVRTLRHGVPAVWEKAEGTR